MNNKLVMTVLSNGSVVCWGDDVFNLHCGYGAMDEPTLALGPSCVQRASSRDPMASGITWDRRVQIWGTDDNNAAGNGDAPDPAFRESMLVELPTTEPIVLVSPGSPMMAMTESGELYLWGDIWPDDDPDNAIENPFPVRFELPAPAAGVGEIAQCMLAIDGSAYCFRNNEAGKLGVDDPGLFTLDRPGAGPGTTRWARLRFRRSRGVTSSASPTSEWVTRSSAASSMTAESSVKASSCQGATQVSTLASSTS